MRVYFIVFYVWNPNSRHLFRVFQDSLKSAQKFVAYLERKSVYYWAIKCVDALDVILIDCKDN